MLRKLTLICSFKRKKKEKKPVFALFFYMIIKYFHSKQLITVNSESSFACSGYFANKQTTSVATSFCAPPPSSVKWVYSTSDFMNTHQYLIEKTLSFHGQIMTKTFHFSSCFVLPWISRILILHLYS